MAAPDIGPDEGHLESTPTFARAGELRSMSRRMDIRFIRGFYRRVPPWLLAEMVGDSGPGQPGVTDGASNSIGVGEQIRNGGDP